VSDARVDLIIAVHTPTRPVGRAVASVLDGNAANVRLTVACHNTDPDGILAVIDDRHRGSVTVLEHIDEHRSASGPFNAGMRAARGEFVSIMGSDDTLRPGAVDSWLAHADANGAETVMTRLALGHPDAVVPTPPVRPFTRGLADPIADRLSYRSAPLGLVSVAAKERLGAELVEGAVVGGDVPYVTRLWFETTVAVDRTGPAYVIGEDARDRVTYEPRPIAVELAFVRHLLAADWFAAYPTNARVAVVTKLTRIHLFGAVHNRTDPTWWTDQERIDLAHVARLRTGPVARRPPPAGRDPLQACHGGGHDRRGRGPTASRPAGHSAHSESRRAARDRGAAADDGCLPPRPSLNSSRRSFRVPTPSPHRPHRRPTRAALAGRTPRIDLRWIHRAASA
jgi:hypothetical protein